MKKARYYWITRLQSLNQASEMFVASECKSLYALSMVERLYALELEYN